MRNMCTNANARDLLLVEWALVNATIMRNELPSSRRACDRRRRFTEGLRGSQGWRELRYASLWSISATTIYPGRWYTSFATGLPFGR